MLKSTFKKVSAIAIAGTMLAGMMAVPANAWSSTQVSKTETAINEDFSSFSPTASQVMGEDPAPFAGDSSITVNKYAADDNGNYPSGFKASIGENNSLSLMGKQGAKTVIYNKAGSTAVQRGDVITVTFKYKYDANQGKMRVNLNDSSTSRSNFVYLASQGSFSDAVDHASDAGKARILCISMGNQRIHETDAIDGTISGRDYWRGPNITTNAWNAITITIDTANDEYEGKQTIKVQKGSNYFIGYYDADYTGEGDTTYDIIDEISSITFATNGPLWGVSGVAAEDGTPNEGTPNCWIDDISVQVTGDRPEYVSDLSKTVINENFSNLTASWSGYQTWNAVDVKKPLTGTVLEYCVRNTGTGGVGYPDATSEKAFKMTGVHDNSVALYMNANETLAAGDIVNMSFDYYQTNQNGMYVALQGLNDKGVAHKSISSTNWYGSDQGADKGNGWRGPNWGLAAATNDIAAMMASTGVQSGYEAPTTLTPVYGHNGGNAAQNTFLTGRWYTIELSINTKDAAHGNKQTLSLKYKERGADTYTQEYLSYYDADATTIGDDKVDALSVFKGFDIGVTLKNPSENSDAVYIDNVKAEIVKPGFEVADDHTASGNTYTFSGTTPIDLNYVTNASAANVIVAQYDNTERMISAKPVAVAATGRGTVTVTPVEGAQTIKLMVLDMSTAVPYAKVFKLTKSN